MSDKHYEAPTDPLGGLRHVRLECSPGPTREASLRELAGRVTESTTARSKEPFAMGVFTRLFGGRAWPVKAALAAAAIILLLAASQLLPFAGGIRHAPALEAASGGYVLIFNFGPNKPTPEMHEQGHKIINQWVEENHIDLEQMTLNGGQDVVDGQYSVSLALIGATQEQADSLAAAFKAVPGAPAPQVVEASWYQVEAAAAEKRGELLLYEFDHAFIFARGTTAEQVEQTLTDYVVQTKGRCDFRINVHLEWTADGHSCTVNLEGPEAAEGEDNSK